ncbi:6-phospho-beta-galactosidase [Enterococcus sp. JM4C]|uniref:6-phospho-beta-galactosidase n=1 Tax=Candidatus Enterococcus huntleyi TaxID=1857217 RepID=UPI00137A8666|nr:6-phospho-beta-galactosidase [Enterococcus sp. JM4C]KAF1299424.1 6-phospho-beta-galactosidase [Enterococcus sp. JM4C]
MLKLPKDFVFGAATAAYQTEGSTTVDGKGRVLWDQFLEEQGRFSADPACDFYNQYPIDFKNAREFGITSLRVSIAWSRIFPEGYGKIEPRGVAFYHRMFKEMKDNGIEPYVTLHHFDTPEALFVKGDWLNKEMIDHFTDFATFCFEEYKEIHFWITINEPTTLAKQQRITGTFPPGAKYQFADCFQQQHYLNLAHARVVNKFREMNVPGEIGVVHAIQTVYPNSEKEADRLAAIRQDVLENKFLLDGTLKGSYSPELLEIVESIIKANNQSMIKITSDELAELEQAAETVDFVGVNYYYSKFVESYDGPSEFIHNGTGTKGSSKRKLAGVGQEVLREGLPTTDWDWPIYPQGLGDTLRRISQDYPNVAKIYITENGLGKKETPDENGEIIDTERIEYIENHLKEVAKVIEEGVRVAGYFIWSYQDMFSWTNGYNKRYGLFYVDFETQERIPKKSAYWYKELIENNKK